jgi:serine protease Do
VSDANGTGGLEDLGRCVARLGAAVGPAVVGLGPGWGTGSGVVIAEGLVLTSVHNLRSAEVSLSFFDGRRADARVAGSDADRDLAALEADTADIVPLDSGAEPATVGIGTPVVALADPGGRGLRAAPGFVVAAPRSFRGPRGRRAEGGIEHTAPLPRGSSGGPLVDLSGRLLGVNTLRLEGGLILAIGVDAGLRERIGALARGEASEPRRLGVAVASPRAARRMRRAVGLPDRQGLLVRSVQEGSAAARAGIETGDLLVAAGERALDGVDALYGVLEEHPADRPLELTVLRGAEERELTVSFAGAEEATR